MDELKVFWSNSALVQRNRIFEYWNRRNQSKEYSIRLNLSINSRIKTVRSYPKLGKPTNIKGYRAIVIGHYNIVYRIRNESIVIVAVFDTRQSPEKLKV